MSAYVRSALVLVFALAGCDRCRKQSAEPASPQPAGPRERAAIDHLLTGSDLPSDLVALDTYESLIGELERNPKAALLAVRERRAPEGSRQALFLKVLEHRFSDVSAHRRRRETLARARVPAGKLGDSYRLDISGLTGRDADVVWTEALLLENEMGQGAAILYLDRIGTALAIEALSFAASTPERYFNAGLAGRALGRRGEAERLVKALAGWESSSLAPESAGPLAGLAYLRPDALARANTALLAGLEATDATPKQRTLLLHGLAITGDEKAIARLAALRRTPWGEAQKAEIDATIERIATRPSPDPSAPPIDWNEDLLTGEKRRQDQFQRRFGGP